MKLALINRGAIVCRITTERFTTVTQNYIPSLVTIADVDGGSDATVLGVAVVATMPPIFSTAGDAGSNVEETSFLSEMTETVWVAHIVVGKVANSTIHLLGRMYTCEQRCVKADFTSGTSERKVPFRRFLALSSIPHCNRCC